MNAVRAAARDFGRRAALGDVVDSVLMPYAFSDRRQHDLAQALQRVLLSALDVADSLAVRLLELEATERRADDHVRTCPICRRRWRIGQKPRPCSTFAAIRRDIDSRQRLADAEYRTLVRRA
jgi:hypothetical protein